MPKSPSSNYTHYLRKIQVPYTKVTPHCTTEMVYGTLRSRNSRNLLFLAWSCGALCLLVLGRGGLRGFILGFGSLTAVI